MTASKRLRLLLPHPDGSEDLLDAPIQGTDAARLRSVTRRLRRPKVPIFGTACCVVYIALLEGVPRDPPYSLYVGSASGRRTVPDDAGRFPCEWEVAPQRRYRDHKRNHKAGAGRVQDYGLGLLPDLYARLNPIAEEAREAFETKVAVRLREAGWVVHQH